MVGNSHIVSCHGCHMARPWPAPHSAKALDDSDVSLYSTHTARSDFDVAFTIGQASRTAFCERSSSTRPSGGIIEACVALTTVPGSLSDVS